MASKRLRLSGLVLLLLVGSFLPIFTSRAQATSCTASLGPSNLSPIETDIYMTLQIFNQTSQDFHWVKITSPTTNFIVDGIISTPVSVTSTVTNNSITMSSGSSIINAGTLNTIKYSIDVGLNEISSVNWTVQAGPNQDGSSIVGCSGTLGTSAYGYYPYDYSQGVSNVVVSDITDTTAVVSWDSSAPTSSIVYYNDSPDQYLYKTDLDGTQTTSHSVTVSGLLPSTGYHFMAAGASSDHRPVWSADGTFLTTATPPPGGGGGGSPGGGGGGSPGGGGGSSGSNLSGSTSTIGHTFSKSESTPPTVSVSTPLGKRHPYKQAPLIQGTASDNRAVFSVEYSTDGGVDWLPADKVSGLGSASASFSFRPKNLREGDYKILVRAIDTSGNIGKTKAFTLVIDKLPPLVGGIVVSLGPQILYGDSSGRISVVAGVDEKVTFSAVGGPTSIKLVAQNTSNKKKGDEFTMTQSPDTGLWSGILGFKSPGTYKLTAQAVDGAGNKTDTLINTVDVSAPSKVVDQSGKAVKGATVTAYYFEPGTDSWGAWDGAAYGQTNPQPTDRNGNFHFFLPNGKYYLKVSANGFSPVTSNIFQLSRPSPVVTTLKLGQNGGLKLGGYTFFDFSTQPVNLNLSGAESAGGKLNSRFVGQPVPGFSLKNLNGRTVSDLDLLGKPTDLVFINTWAPAAGQQLSILSSLAQNDNFNVLPVALQEDAAKVAAYDEIAGLKLSWLVDPSSSLSASFGSPALPTHYFINRDGHVKAVIGGVLSMTELENELSSL